MTSPASVVSQAAALLVLVATYLAALFVVVHGYLVVPNYTPPALLAGIVASGLTTAAAVAGWQANSLVTRSGNGAASSHPPTIHSGGAQ